MPHETVTVDRKDDDHKMSIFVYKPEAEIKGVVQIVHGMAEHIERYHLFMEFLASNGYVCAGHTLRGHGEDYRDQLGHFADKNGWELLISDIRSVFGYLEKEFSSVPIYLFGHSMGSFLSREYMIRYSRELCGVLLTGTGYYSSALTGFGTILASCFPARKHSSVLEKISFSSNNKSFVPARTALDWLNRDPIEIDKYIADPFCGFSLTAASYKTFFAGLKQLTKTKRLQSIRKDLPILIISGDHDPVGQMGKGINLVAEQLRESGLLEVTVRLYHDARHELLNELNREEVYQDVLKWLDQHGRSI